MLLCLGVPTAVKALTDVESAVIGIRRPFAHGIMLTVIVEVCVAAGFTLGHTGIISARMVFVYVVAAKSTLSAMFFVAIEVPYLY